MKIIAEEKTEAVRQHSKKGADIYDGLIIGKYGYKNNADAKIKKNF